MPTAHHHLNNASDLVVHIAQSPAAIATTITTAVSSPWWLPWMQTASSYGALLLPIIGCLVGTMQFALLVRKWRESANSVDHD